MALSRKRRMRSERKKAIKPRSGAPDTRQMLTQVEAMIRELQIIRGQLVQLLPLASSEAGLTDRLFGAAGHGTPDEYDSFLDWERFSEWQTR